MNSLGISLLWTALQVSLFCMAGAGAYLVACRRRPAWNVTVLCGVLTMTAGISALSFSPWPRWQPLGRMQTAETVQAVASDRGRSSSPPTPADGAEREPASDAAAASLNVSVLDLLSAIWGDVQTQLHDEAHADLETAAWNWPAWLALALLAGIAVGATRALVGLFALTRLLRETQTVTDPLLTSLLEQLRTQLRCRAPIELREMSGARAHGSPAVVGWRRPVILLPSDWRSWSEDVRRGILAHETAHVAHGDFLKWLTAQVGVVLHFYNPLVHWLARRLRLEQELAADACGAALAGGAKSYLTVLAQMALEQDQSRTLWAGRPFFPTRGTLMRRIEMLNRQSFVTQRSSSRLGPAALLTALAFVGLALSGFRGPKSSTLAAETPAKEKPAENAHISSTDAPLPAFDDSYLPAETIAVMSIKPVKAPKSDVVIEPGLLSFPEGFGFAFRSEEKDKVRSWAIEEARTIVLRPAPLPASAAKSPELATTPFLIIYRTSRPYDSSKLRVKIFGDAPDGVSEITVHGCKCFRTASEYTGDLVNFLLVDERTIVVMRERDRAHVLAADSKRHPNWYAQWQEAAKSPMAIGVDSALAAAIETEAKDAVDQAILSILKDASLILGRVDFGPNGLTITATAHCSSPEKAAATTRLAKAGLGSARQAIPALVTPALLPGEYRTMDVAAALVQMLSASSLNVQAMQLRFEAKLDADFVAQFAETTEKCFTRQAEEFKARRKEDEKTHIAKLGRLAEAMNAFHNAHGHYPPAAVVGPDGKTVHSWRVELLPYLGEQKLFDSYKLDEPWDSEHNKQLVEKIPDIYSTTKTSKQGYADYCVVTGKGTLFDADALPTRESITDAPSETILVLQTVPRTPWTKPEDLELSADHEPPRPFRGRLERCHAAFADGTVELIPKRIDSATIRAMFTKAGGDQVKRR